MGIVLKETYIRALDAESKGRKCHLPSIVLRGAEGAIAPSGATLVCVYIYTFLRSNSHCGRLLLTNAPNTAMKLGKHVLDSNTQIL